MNIFRMREKGSIGVALAGVVIVSVLILLLTSFIPVITQSGVNSAIATVITSGQYIVMATAEYDSLVAKANLNIALTQDVSNNLAITSANVTKIVKDSEYTEEHLHHKVRWYGKLATQTTNLWADSATLTPYVVTSGNNTWSVDNSTDVALVFGPGDILTELGPGILGGDFNEILVTANTSDTPYRLRFLWGTGTSAQAAAAGQFTETMYQKKSSDSVRIVRNLTCPVIPITISGLPVKIWSTCWNATNDATLSFVIGIHGYDFE